MSLTGPQQNQLITGLQRWTYPQLSMLLNEVESAPPLVNIAPATVSRQELAFAVVQRAVDEFWAFETVAAAHRNRPADPDLTELYAALRIGDVMPDPAQISLERYYQDQGMMFDPAVLRAEIEPIERRVCSIKFPGPGKELGGTGFLLGPDVVITNHHVMSYVIDHPAIAPEVTVTFDYRVDEAGGEPTATTHGLATDGWLIDSSPHAPSDEVQSVHPPDVDTNHLDYALIRLADKAGCEPGHWGDAERGWIDVPALVPPLAVGAALLIMQHPGKERIKLAMHPASIISGNDSGTRVRHKTATEGGSSGAPCFDGTFRLVALHHAGDPNFAHPADYNQAVPIGPIIAKLQQNGHGDLVGGAC